MILPDVPGHTLERGSVKRWRAGYGDTSVPYNVSIVKCSCGNFTADDTLENALSAKVAHLQHLVVELFRLQPVSDGTS